MKRDWTTKEIRLCMDLRSRGLTCGQIAMALRRSRGAIASQISQTLARQILAWNAVKACVRLPG